MSFCLYTLYSMKLQLHKLVCVLVTGRKELQGISYRVKSSSANEEKGAVSVNTLQKVNPHRCKHISPLPKLTVTKRPVGVLSLNEHHDDMAYQSEQEMVEECVCERERECNAVEHSVLTSSLYLLIPHYVTNKPKLTFCHWQSS